MTLGEIKIETLKKMFLNSEPITIDKLDEYKRDNKYSTYLNMFNQAINEGLLICMKRGKEILKSYDIISDGKPVKCDLSNLIADFYKLYKVLINDQESTHYQLVTDVDLILPSLPNNTKITIIYEAYPELINDLTNDDEEIKNHVENLSILPLYIASQLYKDDDIARSTMYRNEFEAQIDNKMRKENNTHFISINGWL